MQANSIWLSLPQLTKLFQARGFEKLCTWGGGEGEEKRQTRGRHFFPWSYQLCSGSSQTVLAFPPLLSCHRHNQLPVSAATRAQSFVSSFLLALPVWIGDPFLSAFGKERYQQSGGIVFLGIIHDMFQARTTTKLLHWTQSQGLI